MTENDAQSGTDTPTQMPRAPREALFLGASFETSRRPATGRIRNISPTGALLETSEDLGIGETIVVSFRGIDPTPATVKRRTAKGYGIHFEAQIDPSVCRVPAASSQLSGHDDFVLHLREEYRRPIWDTRDMSFKRPKLK